MNKFETETKTSRRHFLTHFSFEVVGAILVTAAGGLLGFWLVSRDEIIPAELSDTSLEIEDIELLSDLDFLQEFDVLESLKNEDLS